MLIVVEIIIVDKPCRQVDGQATYHICFTRYDDRKLLLVHLIALFPLVNLNLTKII